MTPGPWTIFSLDGVSDIVPAMRQGTVASGIENDADAHLIAAAPDLLYSLKECVKLLQSLTSRESELERAVAAIAKAEGAIDTTTGHNQDWVSWAYGWVAGRRGDKLTKLQIPAWLNVDEFERGREVGKIEKEQPRE